VCGWQVKLCDPHVTRGPYLSALEIRSLYIKRYINSAVYFLVLYMSLFRGSPINFALNRAADEIGDKSSQLTEAKRRPGELLLLDARFGPISTDGKSSGPLRYTNCHRLYSRMTIRIGITRLTDTLVDWFGRESQPHLHIVLIMRLYSFIVGSFTVPSLIRPSNIRIPPVLSE